MKQIKMLLLSSMVILFTACGGGGSSSGVSTLPIPPDSTLPVPPDTTIAANPIVKFLDLAENRWLGLVANPFINNDDDIIVTFTYYEDGNRLTETREFTGEYFNSQSFTTTYEGMYSYDFDSNEATEIWTEVVEEDSGYTSSSRSGINIYAFDANGYILSSESIGDGSDYSVNTAYTYDTNGILIASESTTVYLNSDSTSSTSSFTYDANRNVLTYVFTGPYSTSNTTTYTYDANGNLLTSDGTRVDIDGSINTYSYTFDANGNVLTFDGTRVLTDGSSSTNSEIYTYDSNGNLLTTESTTVNSDGSSSSTSLIYDANGDWLAYESTSVNPDGSSSSTSSTYDTNGNILTSESTSVNSDGSSYYNSTTYIDSVLRGSSYKSIDATGYWYESTTTYDENGNIIDSTYDSGFLGPIANAGDDIDVGIGETTTLDGSASSDPDGASLTYQWSFESIPDGSNAVISNPTSVAPTFVADINGIYIVNLIVNNGTYNSIVDTVAINTYLLTHVSNTVELRQALLDAAHNGTNDKIVLADGTYKTTDDSGGTFSCIDDEEYSLTIEGSNSNSVLLSGENSHQILKYMSTDYRANLTLINLSIKNGYADGDGGGGVYSNKPVSVQDCTFADNTTTGIGGGLSVVYETVTIINSEFINNVANSNGGGFFATNSEVINSIFINNEGRVGGGFISTGSATVLNTIFTDNVATSSGGGFGCNNTQLTNSLFSKNSDGVSIANSSNSNISNTSFLDNTVDVSGPDNGMVTLKNNYIDPSKIDVTNTATDNVFDGINLGYIDYNNRDYHLTVNSDLIDIGINMENNLVDFDGNPRPVGVSTDIGPYEYQ